MKNKRYFKSINVMKMLINFCVLALFAGGMFGCSKYKKQTSLELTLLLPFYGNVKELNNVNIELNKYLEQKVSFRVNLIPFVDGNSLKESLENGENVDIAFCPTYSLMKTLQSADLLVSFDFPDDIWNKISDIYSARYLDISRIEGKVYGLSTNMERTRTVGFEYNRTIAERYNLDFSKVYDLEDLTKVFESLATQTVEIVPIAVLSGFLYFDHVDTLGDSFGVLTEESGNQVINLYETNQFLEVVHILHEWNLKKYTYPDTGENDLPLYYLKSGKVLGCLTIGNSGFEAQEKALSGCDIGYVELSEPYYSSDMTLRPWYVIPSTTVDKKSAVKMMELLYTDPYIANLLMYGVEGEHYTVSDEGLGIRDYNSGYDGIIAWAYCNSFIGYPPEGTSPKLWNEINRMNNTVSDAPSWEFIFDSSSVMQQLYQCENIRNNYFDLIFSTADNPEKLLEQMNRELKAAGLETIIAEKQRQLDRFIEKKDGNR